MRRSLKSWIADYGMVGVLLGLCTLFSLLTIRPQPATGAAGGAALASDLLARWPVAKVVVLATGGEEDRAFVEALQQSVARGGGSVLEQGIGDPRAGRRALAAGAARNPPPDAIAVSAAAASWVLLESVAGDFPPLAAVPVVRAEGRMWPDFLKLGNLLNIANHIVVVAVIAIGMTMVIITGGIDLSVGSVIALSAVTTGLLIERQFGAEQAGPGGMIAACLAGMGVATLIGIANGALITLVRVPPFIVTLATMLIASGTAYKLTGGEEAYHLPASFVWLGRGARWGIPHSVALMAVLYGTAHLVMSRTVLGRHIYAVGGNPLAARLSGIANGRVILFVYAVCSLLAGLGGVIMASELKSGSPRYGQMYELYVIAAVVVGGTSLAGGSGTMFGTLIGALIIAVIRNGMNLLHVESYTQNVIFGLVILGAVILDQLKNRRLRHG